MRRTQFVNADFEGGKRNPQLLTLGVHGGWKTEEMRSALEIPWEMKYCEGTLSLARRAWWG